MNLNKITELTTQIQFFVCVSLTLIPYMVNAAGVPTLKDIIIRANARELIGTASSANEGTVLKQQLDARTVYRPGELLETVPGLIVTQHSGEGKANQYFLRGFNLDHGTDLRITIDGAEPWHKTSGDTPRRNLIG